MVCLMLVAELKTLPGPSIVLYAWQQSRNRQGTLLESTDHLGLIAGTAQVPIYGLSGQHIGRRMTGGHVFTLERIGAQAAELVLAIANGARAQDIPVQASADVPTFDWRQLQRWGIDENQLPANRVIQTSRFVCIA
ncbi:MAG: hypothetical protein ACRENP_08285 [Longimicrobiales bacterium]